MTSTTPVKTAVAVEGLGDSRAAAAAGRRSARGARRHVRRRRPCGRSSTVVVLGVSGGVRAVVQMGCSGRKPLLVLLAVMTATS